MRPEYKHRMERNRTGVFYLRWARLGAATVHGGTPSVEQCEAEGYRAVGGDPRYPSVLMRKDDDASDE
jgi:hypothetical protein